MCILVHKMRVQQNVLSFHCNVNRRPTVCLHEFYLPIVLAVIKKLLVDHVTVCTVSPKDHTPAGWKKASLDTRNIGSFRTGYIDCCLSSSN